MERYTFNETSDPVNATILTAFAAEDKLNGGYLHVEMNLAKNGSLHSKE